MKLSDALSGVSRIGFDTSPIIYFVESNPNYVDVMRSIFQQVDSGTLTGCTGMITLSEVLVKPLQNGNRFLADAYRTILFNSRNFYIVPIDAAVAERAAELRSRYKLKLPDALQVVAALEAGCNAFLTNDRHYLKSITELNILFCDDLEL